MRFHNHPARPAVCRRARTTCALLAALLALALAVPVVAARGLVHLDDSGMIAGTLVNGTHGGTPLASQLVTLQLTLGAQAQDVMTATSDSQGHFSFSSLPTAAQDVYAVYTRYEGGMYSTGAIHLDANPVQQTTLTVYEATSSDASISANDVILLVRQPRPANGLIGIGEFVRLHNSGTTAFVGSLSPANGLPMGLLRFALPTGATNLTPGLGFAGAQITQVPTGFGATATVPPGDTLFAFAYDTPYDGTQALISFKAEYPTGALTILVPTNMRGGGAGFRAQGTTQALAATYQVFESAAMGQNDVRTLHLSGLVAAGQPVYLDLRALVALAAALAVLGALLLALYLKRGAFALVLPLAWLPLPRTASPSGAGQAPRGDRTLARSRAKASAPPANGNANGKRSAQHAAQHDVLLRELLALERDCAAGRLDQERYLRRAGEVRAALRALLAEEDARATPPAPAAHEAPVHEVLVAEMPTATGGGP